MALAIAGSALWLLGHPDAAVESHERAQALAARIAHPFTQAACTAFYAAAAWGGNGNSLIEQGRIEEGIERAQESCRRYKANGSRRSRRRTT